MLFIIIIQNLFIPFHYLSILLSFSLLMCLDLFIYVIFKSNYFYFILILIFLSWNQTYLISQCIFNFLYSIFTSWWWWWYLLIWYLLLYKLFNSLFLNHFSGSYFIWPLLLSRLISFTFMFKLRSMSMIVCILFNFIDLPCNMYISSLKIQIWRFFFHSSLIYIIFNFVPPIKSNYKVSLSDIY